MKKILSERNFVVILFIAAFVVFSFAQEDTKKIERKLHPTAVSIPHAPKAAPFAAASEAKQAVTLR